MSVAHAVCTLQSAGAANPRLALLLRATSGTERVLCIDGEVNPLVHDYEGAAL